MTFDADTVKAFLVANATIIWSILISILLSFISIIHYNIDQGPTEGIIEWGVIVLFFGGTALFISFLIRAFIENTIVCILYLLACIPVFLFFLTYTIECERSMVFFSRIALLLVILSIWMGIRVGRYAFKHYQEVVSRRYFYRNSNTSVFEDATKYAINRGVVVCTCVHSLLMVICILILTKISKAEVIYDSVIGFVDWILNVINK